MAVTVVEKTGGSAANAEAVTVTFSDAVAGDLILFCYGTYLKTGEDDWLANSDWEQIFSAGFAFLIAREASTSLRTPP